MLTIIIYRRTGAGCLWLCADGSLSSERAHAAHHWHIQFEAIVAENWIVHSGGIASFEVI